MNPEEEEFGESRFKEFIDRNKDQDPAQFHLEFRSAMDKFSKKIPFHDDLTLLSLRFSSK
jgi:sigma-B regulation protein RsbU (phosphoserine phosphatase)